jgi:hypothetical protein
MQPEAQQLVSLGAGCRSFRKPGVLVVPQLGSVSTETGGYLPTQVALPTGHVLPGG